MYDLRFSITSSAAFKTPLTTVLSRARSLFAISLRHCTSSSLLPLTTWYNSQPVSKMQRQQPTTFISMITLAMENTTLTGIDTVWQPLEECLCKPRSHSKIIFCNWLPIWDLHLGIWFCSDGSNVGFVVVLFKMCWKSIFMKTKSMETHLDPQRNPAYLEHLEKKLCWRGGAGNWCWANSTRSVRYEFSSIVIWREAKLLSITLRQSQYTYLMPSALWHHF